MGTKRKVTIEYEDSTSEKNDEDSISDEASSEEDSPIKKLDSSKSDDNLAGSDDESGNSGIEMEDDENVEESDNNLDRETNNKHENDGASENSEDSDREANNEHDNDGASENSEDDGNNDGTTNLCWADAMSKILKTNKPKGKKTLVLSKAKKLTDANQATMPIIKKKKTEIANARVKPDILKRDHERMLSKIATKGVVQLFNAVRKQQKDIDVQLEEAGPLDTKRDKVLKGLNKEEFLNVLMGDKDDVANVKELRKRKESKSNDEPTWSVLRDDFMMGSKMKDWDKELEGESEEENECE